MPDVKSGADDYLAKPFDVEELAARMVTAERVTILHRRREAMLRLARHVATTTEPSALFATLLAEGLRLTRAEAGVVSQVVGEGETDVARKLVGVTEGEAGELLGRMHEVAVFAAARSGARRMTATRSPWP